MSEYLPDHRRVFNAGDYFDRATTFTAGFNVDVEYALESLRPLVRMSRCREAHGCARTASSLMPGAQQGFGLVAAALLDPFYLGPAGPVLPVPGICYGARKPHENGLNGLLAWVPGRPAWQ